jgi:PDZ domain
MRSSELRVARCQFLLAACGLGLLGSVACFAAEPTTRPALQQLSDESRNLYDQVCHEVVRVETPVPQWMFEIARRENPLLKWNQVLDAEVRQKLMARSGGASVPPVLEAELAPANQSRNEPTTAPAMHVVIGAAERNTEDIAPPPQIVHITARVNTLGLILDNQGHVLIPIYLEKSAAAQGPITLSGPDGVSEARFIASDPQSNLTIVQMEKMIGRPAHLDMHRPDIGSLVMILTPNQATAQLAVWTGTNQEFGIVSNMNGQIAGIARMGHLLSADSFQLITRELIAGGVVKRAILGVKIGEIRPDDPIRESLPALGSRPAIVVVEVEPDSIAAKAGILRGDLILQLASHDIEDAVSFATAIAERTGSIDLQILRNGKLIDKHVVLHPQ